MNKTNKALPMNWKSTKLKEVATLSGRIGWKGLTAKEYTDSGPLFLSVHSLNYGDYVDFRDAFHISQARYDESPEIMLGLNDILICKDGAGIGKLGIINELSGPSTINSSLLLIRAGELLYPKFLYYILLSPYFQRIVQSRLEGATTPHLYQRDIKEFPVYFPPLPEQQRIVSILDEVFEGIGKAVANVERNLENSRELFESYLNGVFKPSGSRKEKQIKNITTVVSGHNFKSGDFSDKNEIKSIKITNVGVQKFVQNDTNRLPQEFSENYTKYRIPSGSIVIALTRSIISNGLKVAIVPPDYHRALLNQRVAALIGKPDNISTEFLYYYLCSSSVVDYVMKKANTLMQPNLSIKDLKALKVPTPSLDEQDKMVSALKCIQKKTLNIEGIYQQQLNSLAELKQSILQKAFTGELTSKTVDKIMEPV